MWQLSLILNVFTWLSFLQAMANNRDFIDHKSYHHILYFKIHDYHKIHQLTSYRKTSYIRLSQDFVRFEFYFWSTNILRQTFKQKIGHYVRWI